ncbi:DUF211 domain-containing protein [Sphingomonas sp. H39-1-10]|uniref:DUF211 domain-containing protein n=1 Tax=Sphingomonas pollutisoli TaxID=3030829 RepID=UPI0023B96200|nr:DUF211 domain-containing protein [Sphingomonas pollutisoli]MDF0490543.1 DUF211 domain-containing protein [Sphingomonas pollutisoli]
MSDGIGLNIRRVVLDVDKALKVPTLIEIGAAIHNSAGVRAFNITVTEVDQETMGTSITIEGEQIDYDALVRAIESSGAVVHSLDELVAGDRIIDYVPRAR